MLEILHLLGGWTNEHLVRLGQRRVTFLCDLRPSIRNSSFYQNGCKQGNAEYVHHFETRKG